jgi:ABC-type amino acid transport substrate-binding protein
VKKIPHANLILLNKNHIIVQELILGRIDAALMEEDQALHFCNANKNKITYDVISSDGGCYGIAFPKNSKLYQQINDAIDVLDKNGTILKLEKKWFISKANV